MIRFPKMHIAKSTVNRILNVADEVEPPSIDIPNVPTGDAQGLEIDAALAGDTPEVAAPPGLGLEETLGPNSIL
jgi:hypothetical protein